MINLEKTFDNTIFNSPIGLTLLQFYKNKNIPSLIFYGNPGLGKSTMILILCKNLYKSNFKISIENQDIIYNNFILFLNAWNDRGIQIVRQKIKQFISYKTDFSYCDIFYKTIIFEEADALSIDWQSA